MLGLLRAAAGDRQHASAAPHPMYAGRAASCCLPMHAGVTLGAAASPVDLEDVDDQTGTASTTTVAGDAQIWRAQHGSHGKKRHCCEVPRPAYCAGLLTTGQHLPAESPRLICTDVCTATVLHVRAHTAQYLVPLRSAASPAGNKGPCLALLTSLQQQTTHAYLPLVSHHGVQIGQRSARRPPSC